MRLVLTILLLCGGLGGAVASRAAEPLWHDFEDEAPPDDFTVEGGRLCVSGERYKSGCHALAWDITDSPSTLTYRNPDDLVSAGKPPVMALWLYLPRACSDTLGVELLRGDKVVARGWFGLNFRGWRPLGAAWTDLGWNIGDAVDAVRFTAPENLAGSRLHMDGFCVNARIAPPRPDDQQPWIGCGGRLPEPARTFHTALDLAFNRVWLPPLQGADELTGADRRMMDEARRTFAPTRRDAPRPVNVAELRRAVAADYELNRRGDAVAGRAIITGRGFHEPRSGVELSRYLERVRDAAEAAELRDIWLDLVLHLMEQGFMPGNANMGDAGKVSAVGSLLAHPSDLERIGRLAEVVDATVCLLLGEQDLAEKPAHPPPDWPARLRGAFAAVAVLPPSPQKLQRLRILARHFDHCRAGDKAWPASPETAGQVRELAGDIVAVGLRLANAVP